MGVGSEITGRASRNRIGAFTRGPASRLDLAVRVVRGGICLFFPWVAWLVGLPSGYVAAGGSSERTGDGRVVRDFNGTNLYIPKDFYTSVRDDIYIHRTLGTDENFMT